MRLVDVGAQRLQHRQHLTRRQWRFRRPHLILIVVVFDFSSRLNVEAWQPEPNQLPVHTVQPHHWSGDLSQKLFTELGAQRDGIEREMGANLDWQEIKPQRVYRATLRLEDADALDETDWPHEHLERFNAVFAPRVAAFRMDEEALADEGSS